MGTQGSYYGEGGAPDRFSLLLLTEDEYYFRDYSCNLWRHAHKRVPGQLKVCSESLYFVPRDVHEPILRIPYAGTTSIEQLPEEKTPSGEDLFVVEAREWVELKAAGYAGRQGPASFRLSLVFTAAADVLPRVQDLCLLAQRTGSKQEAALAKQQLAEIIAEHEAGESFNPGWLEDEGEAVVAEARASSVSPLCVQPGRAVLTPRALYFQPFNVVSSAPLRAYPLAQVECVSRRAHQLEDCGLEVFLGGGGPGGGRGRHQQASVYLAFAGRERRDAFERALLAQPGLSVERLRSTKRWTRDWAAGRVSNFDYLMHLNRAAGRSFKDLSQYPVFPWVLADYSSPALDLSDPATFRDLSRPVGALNPRRLADVRERFAELRRLQAQVAAEAGGGGRGKGAPPPPLELQPFMYGCHYSSPGYAVFYLMRSDPQLMLRLQNGRFDAADRLFWSVADTWKSVMSLPTDVKELTPEFYANDPSFLVNTQGIDFGTRANGQRVDDVVLPPWASDPSDFLHKLAEALESPHVSGRLHLWIDLVFGVKSRGEAAERADNVFHYLSYDEIALSCLSRESDPRMREALRLQMMEFGRTPRQLFKRPHPKRRAPGSLSLAACLTCTVPQPRPALPPPPNSLRGKSWAARGIPPVSRAVFKLTSRKAATRAATLAWLESTAAKREPGELSLRATRGAELLVLVRAVRDAREGRTAYATGEEMMCILVRAVRALGSSPTNRRYILDAGALDLLIDAMLGLGPQQGQQQQQQQAPPQQGSLPSVTEGFSLRRGGLAALALLSREDDPRLTSLDRRGLEHLVALIAGPQQQQGQPEQQQQQQQPGDSDDDGEEQDLALTAVTYLARSSANRAYFAEQQVQGKLLQLLRATQEPGPQAGAAALPPQPSERYTRRVTMARQGSQPVPDESAAQRTQRQCGLALAALLQDDDQQKEALLAGGGLPVVLRLCGRDLAPAVQAAGYQCLAALTTHDAMRHRVKELQLLPVMLERAGEGPAAVQRPAAACVAALCADPALVLALLRGGPGLAPVVAMAQSTDSEVQRQAAAALWHLTAQAEGRRRAVAAGALAALLAMARSRRNVRARELALQALRQCYEDPATKPRLVREAEAAGLDAAQLAASTPGGGAGAGLSRLGSMHHSESNLPSSAASAAGSPLAGGRGAAALQRQPSDPASLADTDELSGISRSPSAGPDGFSFGLGPGSGRPGAPLPGARTEAVQPQRLELPDEGNGAPLPLPIISPVTLPVKKVSPRAHPLPPSPASSFKE